MTLPIDHNVPMPKRRSNELRATLEKLRTGDSFVVSTNAKRQQTIAIAYTLDMKVTTAKESGKGYRIWKIK